MIEENIDEYLPEGEEGIPGDHLDEVDDLVETLLETEWPEEAEQIPLDALNPEEQVIILKCRQKEGLTEDEKEQLQQILAQYRPAIQKLKPQETLETAEKNITLIHDEKQFLKELQKARNEELKEVVMYYPTKNGELKIPLDCYPITDSQSILDAQSNLDMFKDTTEQKMYQDYKQGNPQTREEKAIAKKLAERIDKQVTDDSYDIIIEFLSQQTSIKGQPRNPSVMAQAYKTMKVSYLVILMSKVQETIGLNVDINTERVFRESD